MYEEYKLKSSAINIIINLKKVGLTNRVSL